jgi:hypothetical protein
MKSNLETSILLSQFMGSLYSMISGDNIIDYFLLLMDENLGVWNNNGDKDGVRYTTLRASDTLDGDCYQFSAQPDMPGIFAIVNETA